MNTTQKPTLFGLTHTNRDFSEAQNWGKNIFNNAFPVALSCYMANEAIPYVYLTLDQNEQIVQQSLTAKELYGVSPLQSSIFFAFEEDFPPFRALVFDKLPRTDVVVMNQINGQALAGLEIKLTTLPDNSTKHLSDDQFGTELVIRPDSIVYLALSIIHGFRHHKNQLKQHLSPLPKIYNWEDEREILTQLPTIANVINQLLRRTFLQQTPFVLQPVWKTEGSSLRLHPHALDLFVWSNYAFTRLFFRDVKRIENRITRGTRSVIWLAKMLVDFVEQGQVHHQSIIDRLTYNTKNDKAFAVNGHVTHTLMQSPELTQPRIKREAIRHIILGGGEKLLSPERRLDAAILSTPEVFED